MLRAAFTFTRCHMPECPVCAAGAQGLSLAVWLWWLAARVPGCCGAAAMERRFLAGCLLQRELCAGRRLRRSPSLSVEEAVLLGLDSTSDRGAGFRPGTPLVACAAALKERRLWRPSWRALLFFPAHVYLSEWS